MSGFISILFTSWILYTHAHCAKKTMTMSHKWPNFYKSNFRNYIFTILLREREVETMWWRRGRTSRGGQLIFVKISILYFKFFHFSSHELSFPHLRKMKKATSKHESFQLRYVCHFSAAFWGNTKKNSF